MTSTYTRSSLISHSRKSSNCGDRSPRVTFQEAPEDYNEVKSDPIANAKMQKELLTLQTRVLELEMKLSSFTSPTALNSTKANGNRNSSLAFSSTQDISKLNPGLMTSQRATLLDQSRRNISTIRASPILQQNQLESRASPEGYSKVLIRSSSGLSTQVTNRKSTSRKTLKTEMNDYSSDNFYSVSRSISSMSTKGNTSKRRIEKVYDEGDDEATRLYKYIKVLRREYHSDKAELIKERVKGNELAEKLRKLERKINKLDTNLNVASKVQEKYEDLIESFGKSETMRKQQRTLIESLNSELSVLKGEDELPSQEMGFETSKSKLLVSRGTRKKSHSKKKTAKIF